ncbi:hypothetical protein LRS05_01870 [Flavobacterium sp. J372]|uniref:hypothetical protein n=1 Tax=Flavobacterium sp. J372 TaxID=2898436 RepID=UPI002150D033|nr:hypothetical protein [Flavobacterium sp. J372]MCR5860967.1 hypothetical protein [Flavobacterium sp. J372]
MTTFTIILTLLIICLIGYWSLRQIYARQKNSLEFAIEFKNRFVTLANKYFKSYDSWSREGEVDYEQYTWLTKNVDQMQYDLGRIGIIDYVAPFTRYHIPRYQVLVNTLPKFRERLQNVEVNIADDCLARHIGISESIILKK